jgi:1-acyl-sn-glycerol-3-phosphate acyltransferase
VLFVSRGDVAHWPVVGALARLGGTIFLDRSRRRDAARAGDDVGVWLDRGFRVVVFLEGRAGPGGDVLPFRSSLLEPAVRRGVPCVGASIAYALPDDPGADVTQEVGWSDDAPFGAHVLRLLRRRRITAHVAFHAPRTGDDRKALAAALEEDVRRGLEAGSQI